MGKSFAPMLSATIKTEAQLEKLTYPIIGLYKYDGIRVVFHKELGVVTKSLKPIPNKALRQALEWDFGGTGFEGEIIHPDGFQAVQSAVMSHEADFSMLEVKLFDDHTYPDNTFVHRLGYIANEHEDHTAWFDWIYDKEDAIVFYKQAMSQGMEGIVLRNPDKPYKYGRSTLREQGLMKYKPIFDCECVIIGFEEQMTNHNPKEKNALGLSERASKQENKVPAGTLGNLLVRAVNGELEGVEWSVGTGLTDEQRQVIWDSQKEHLDKIVTIEYAGIGSKGKPRFPSFKGFRNKNDM